jgi:hypothetical protein
VNRYQRRKYGSSLPPPRGPRPGRLLIYLVALLLVLAVIYFRVFARS